MTELLTPSTQDQLRNVASAGPLLAGGTDLLVQIRAGRHEAYLVDVSNLTDGPPCVAESEGHLEISALSSISRVISELAGRLPGLAAAASVFASLQIRNRATIGGNLANASPAGDMIPPLVAADATAVLEGPSGSREIAVSTLAEGPGKTLIAPGEWISALRVTGPKGEEGFRKLGSRMAMAISIVSLAWRWTIDDDGALTGVRLAVGATAPTVFRCVAAENELEGHRPSRAIVDRAVLAIRDAVSPIDDVRASAWYRREVIGGLLQEAVQSGSGHQFTCSDKRTKENK
jgi:CO/xanthine dehydrogenase FAD-binding subunit